MDDEDMLCLIVGNRRSCVLFFILSKNIGTEKEIMSSWQNQTFVVACDTVSGTGGGSPFDNFGPNLEPNIGKMHTVK